MEQIIDEISRILSDLAKAKNDKLQDIWIKRYQVEEDFTKNQFVVLLKPEIIAVQDDVNVEGILRLVFKAFLRWNVEIRAIRVLTADYLRQYRIIDNLYGVINHTSRWGFDAISADARRELEREFGSDLRLGAEVLGGHQFIERYPKFSPSTLSALSDSIGPKKLASGTYCLRLEVDGKILLVLNAFHPFQVENFTKRGKNIVIFEALSNTTWSILRRQLLGATDPTKAAEGSIRQMLLMLRSELGLSVVNLSNNGVHMSSGPLEGMIELQSLFSEHEISAQLSLRETCFGHMLLNKGLPELLLDKLVKHPTIEKCKCVISSHDLTEEIDSEAAAEKLIQMYENNQLQFSNE
jgi:hypothetical protein